MKQKIVDNNLRFNKNFTDFFQVWLWITSHDNNMMGHVVIIFGIYTNRKLSKNNENNWVMCRILGGWMPEKCCLLNWQRIHVQSNKLWFKTQLHQQLGWQHLNVLATTWMVNYRTIRVVKPKYNGRLENKITGNVSGQCRKIKIRGMKFHDVFRECFETIHLLGKG